MGLEKLHSREDLICLLPFGSHTECHIKEFGIFLENDMGLYRDFKWITLVFKNTYSRSAGVLLERVKAGGHKTSH